MTCKMMKVLSFLNMQKQRRIRFQTGYVAGKDKINPEKLIYITDEDLLSAISRKTTQLHALLKSCYNKDIAKELIEQAIRRQIKYLAYNTQESTNYG